MQIDSTPLDVAVEFEDGITGHVELTALVDVATRSIPPQCDGVTGLTDQLSICAAPEITAACQQHKNLITRHGRS